MKFGFNKKEKKFFSTAFTILVIFSFAYVALGAEMTGTNFKIIDPVVGAGGGYGASTNFQTQSYSDLTTTGWTTSTNFIGKMGFLYFPFVTAPVLTANVVGATVELDWTVSSAGQGWSVGGYNVGKATVSGGPYTYTDVGNVITYDYTEQPPGYYCFIVQTYDALDYVIATSNEECVTVLPVITFDIDAAVTDQETIPPYAVPLGVLSASGVKSSGSDDGVNMIILEGESNAPGGFLVTVRNANGANGMVSTSVPVDNIGSADGVMSAGTENYGLCVMSATASSGTLSKASPYDTGTCVTNGNTNDVQALTTSGENLVTSGGSPVYGAQAQVSVNASISVITPAHNDYTDTLTFIATGTF